MGLTKFGTSDDQKIVPEKGDDKKTAKANFTEADEKALQEENARADQ